MQSDYAPIFQQAKDYTQGRSAWSRYLLFLHALDLLGDVRRIASHQSLTQADLPAIKEEDSCRIRAR